MFSKYIILVVHVATVAFCANILAIIPTPSYSHQKAYYDFWNQLSLRGHKVTVITSDPQKNETLTNLTEIDINWAYKFFADISDLAENSLTMWSFHKWAHDMSYNISEALLSQQQIQDFLHNKQKHFDVLLVEFFYVELLVLAEKYNCPTILFSTMDVFVVTHERIGNPTSPALYPDEGSSFYAPLSFSERIASMIYYLHTILFYEYISHPIREKLLHMFFNTTSTINKLIDNIDMVFINANPVIQHPRAVGPTTIYTGSLNYKFATALPKDLKHFLDNATNGFIYFSLGSNVKSKDLKAESLKAIVETLRELPYKVMWKFEADPEDMVGKPDNVKLVKWAPQLGVLAHPHLKLFVTQGGLQSMDEAIFNEVPCVVIPFFADQYQNAKLMKNKGFAEIVERSPYIKQGELTNAIMKVINNYSKYKNSVRTLKQLSLDTPMTGLEKAIWWTEYVIRNKGAKHLRNPAADLPLYQYYLLDVICFLLSITIFTLLVIYIVLKKLLNLLKVRFSTKLDLVDKKSQ
ncbi:UDP-glucuronosyltransferase 2B7-like [Anoplophora glabripennis]|uniref:UDP-glucuronosyltransferase 2B7-like n=1 Tax=Anoplophora glabripennis TaxID=217634 RepID=UPI0008750EBA|nr:UDP-glucuronosyltransferase 2B7-like [Anoplophora glabripennis]